MISGDGGTTARSAAALPTLADAPSRRGVTRFAALLLLHHPVRTAGAVVLPLLTSTMLLGTALLVGRLTDGILAADRGRVLVIGVALVLVAFVTIWLDALADAMLARLGEAMVRDLRDRMVDHLLRAPLRFLERHQPGELLHRATGEVSELSTFARTTLPVLVGAVSTLAVTLVTLVTQSLLLLGALLLVLIPGAALVVWQFLRRAPQAEAFEAAATADIADAVRELVRVRSVWQQAPGDLTAAMLHGEERRNARCATAEMRSVRAGMWIEGLSVVEGACLAALLVAGGHLVGTGSVSVGVVVTFVLAARTLLSAADELTALAATTVEAATSLARVRDLLTCSAVDSDAPIETRTAGDRVPERLELDRVSFGYGGEPVLRDVTLRVEPGERLCLVGRTGAGKSTLAKVMAGLYRPDAGVVRYGGDDLRCLSVVERSARFAYLPQAMTYVGVVRDVLSLAGEVGDDALYAAAARLGLGGWLRSLPEGLDTPVQGSLSVGERQLVGLIRVAVLDAPVLVLDEITSDLDPRTAALVEPALHRIAEGRTFVLVAHRPETVHLFHSNGRVVHVGADAVD